MEPIPNDAIAHKDTRLPVTDVFGGKAHTKACEGTLRIGLMTGIGGGVPNENADIRLGDVVVGSLMDNLGVLSNTI